jgi:hypothetical protein
MPSSEVADMENSDSDRAGPRSDCFANTYEGKRFLAGGLHQPVEDLLQPRFCLLG